MNAKRVNLETHGVNDDAGVRQPSTLAGVGRHTPARTAAWKAPDRKPCLLATVLPLPPSCLIHEERVFLTPPEFVLLRDNIERQRWKNLETWLVSTGMRFSEATALSAADIDANAGTLPNQQGLEVFRRLPARAQTTQAEEVDPPSACRQRPLKLWT